MLAPPTIRAVDTLVGAYPRGSLCALLGLLVVSGHYWRALRVQSHKADADAADYPVSDFRFWTRRQALLTGISLTAIFVTLSSIVDASRDPEWSVAVLAAWCLSAALITCVVGCVFLARHWREALADLRENRAELFEMLSAPPARSQRFEMAFMRMPMLAKSMGAICVVALGVLVAKVLGIAPERLLENPVVAGIYNEILWIFIVTFLVVLWTTRNRFVLWLRMGVLLLFSAIIAAGVGALSWWVMSAVGPALILLNAATVLANVAFFNWSRFPRDPSQQTAAHTEA